MVYPKLNGFTISVLELGMSLNLSRSRSLLDSQSAQNGIFFIDHLQTYDQSLSMDFELVSCNFVTMKGKRDHYDGPNTLHTFM